MGGKQSAPPGRVTAVAIKNRSGFCLHLQNLNRSASNWFWIFVAKFVEALVEKFPVRQRLRQRLPTKFSAPLTFATAFSSWFFCRTAVAGCSEPPPRCCLRGRPHRPSAECRRKGRG